VSRTNSAAPRAYFLPRGKRLNPLLAPKPDANCRTSIEESFIGKLRGLKYEHRDEPKLESPHPRRTRPDGRTHPPGSADVLVGIAPAQADGDVGAPSTRP